MKLDHVEVTALPMFSRAYCPKCKNTMAELQNGWFSVCWYCEKCRVPYQLKMTKMRKYSQANLDKALADLSK